MIPHDFLLHAAETSGFGGVNRVRYLSRLSLFAEQIANWEREQCAKVCNDHALLYRDYETDFMDGKMDGAFMCAELILKRTK